MQPLEKMSHLLMEKKKSPFSANPHDIRPKGNKYQPVPPFLGIHLCSHTPTDRSDDKTKPELWAIQKEYGVFQKKSVVSPSYSKLLFLIPTSCSSVLVKLNSNKEKVL